MAISRVMEKEAARYPAEAVDRACAFEPSPYLNGPRHCFLCACVPDVHPRILSRALDRQMRRGDPCLRRCNPPMLALCDAPPNTYAPHVDKTRATFVFGRRALPKLRRELESRDPELVLRAICAVADVVHDPERVCEAVRVNLAAKLVDLMQHEDPQIRERSVAVVETLAGVAAGRDAVLEERNAVAAVQLLTFDSAQEVRFRAALALRVLAEFRVGPFDLDEAALAPFLVHLLLWETWHEIIAQHLATLQLLLELNSTKQQCIYQGAFNPLHAFMYMYYVPKVASGAMEVMSRLASCELGKVVGDQLNIISSLHLRLMLLSPDADLCRSAALLAMNLTHTVFGKKAALANELLEPLLSLARGRGNRGAQLCALQTLANMAEHWPTRLRLLQLEDDLEELEVGDDDTEAVRQRLLAVVRWKP